MFTNIFRIFNSEVRT